MNNTTNNWTNYDTNKGHNMTKSEYYNEIKSLAEYFATGGEWETEYQDRHDDRSSAIHELIDGHQFVIYYSKAADVVRHSDNSNAMFEELGQQEVKDLDTLNTQLAFFAMVADIWEAI
tara:strand:- start:1977 stop:2330 length:354 start_codon:yes stop_codon:yes gene_type:complete